MIGGDSPVTVNLLAFASTMGDSAQNEPPPKSFFVSVGNRYHAELLSGTRAAGAA